jgi:hypothetical protein
MLGALAYRPELAIDNRQWYSRWCQSKGRHASAPSHHRKDRAHISCRAGGVDNMAAGCGKVVVGRACASCVMSWRSILARIASRGAARRAHSTQMRRIAALTGFGGSTGAIMRLLSERCCFLTVSSWRCLSSTKASLGNAESANTVVRFAANTNFANAAVHSDDSPQCHLHASLANAFSRAVVSWGRHFSASTSSANSAACSAAS